MFRGLTRIDFVHSNCGEYHVLPHTACAGDT